MAVHSMEYTKNEQVLALLAAGEEDENVRAVIDDIRRIDQLLTLYSFRSSIVPQRLLSTLEGIYKDELKALYGRNFAVMPHTDSCFLRLEQLQLDLLRIAAVRLARSGRLSISPAQIASGASALYSPAQTQKKGRG